VTHVLQPGEFFKWQGAYGAFTLAKRDMSSVMVYIENQKQHHAGGQLWDDWEQTAIEEDAAASGG
jgi:hypothetical protein